MPGSGGPASPIAISPAPSSPAASSPAPTPSASGGPALAPRAAPSNPPPTLQKPNTPVAAGGIVTTKQWVIPPRPKPGRKPATDTPPTKRKAQNRAAQRAFRERRAARVNELEDKLKDVAAENSARDSEAQETIAALTRNNAALARENTALKRALEDSRREVEQLRAAAGAQQMSTGFITQVASPAPSASSGGENEGGCGKEGGCACASGAGESSCADPPVVPAIAMPLRPRRSKHAAAVPSPEPLGCGGCTATGSCACYTAATAPPKRPASPPSSTASGPKRTRPNPPAPSYLDFETDFTGAYSKASTPMPPDPCGFCSDGTPCVCAEVANAMDMSSSDVEHDEEDDDDEDVKLPPLVQRSPCEQQLPALQTWASAGRYEPVKFEPPVGLGVGLGGVAAAAAAAAASAGQPEPEAKSSTGCNPGNCAQCRDDPMSTLFCQSVVARRAELPDIEGGAVTPRSLSRGRSRGSKRARSETRTADAKEKTYIPCSAAYQTLSRHRGWGNVEDLGALVRPLVIMGGQGCPQVEVSSVRDVLKQLDRRFGAEV